MFTKEKAQKLKGIAILILMWHHCFLSGNYGAYDISFFPLSEIHVKNLAVFFKIGVSIFAFITGYGLYLDYRKKEISSPRWLSRRLIKTLSPFWFIVILSWLVCSIIDAHPWHVYGFEASAVRAVLNALADFMGLSPFFSSPSINVTWWYMSAAITFILLMPVLCYSTDKLGSLVTAAIVLLLPRILFSGLPGLHLVCFIPAFFFGLIFSKHELFTKWELLRQKFSGRIHGRILIFLFMLAALLVSYKLYIASSAEQFWDVQLGILPLIFILFICDYVLPLPLVSPLLSLLGKHSANIFMVHTFFFYYYCPDLIYSTGHFALSIAVLTVISLAVSMLIELLKKLFRYDAFVKRLLYPFSDTVQPSRQSC